MASEIKERRSHPRCAKEVGMHCALLHGNSNRLVVLRNFSERGVYFESDGPIQPGAFIVLRPKGADDVVNSGSVSNAAVSYAEIKNPKVCSMFRSHMIARVRRCARRDGPGAGRCYGIGAEIQILTD